MIMNDWPTVQEMVFGNGKDHEGWLLDLNLATPGGINIFSDENQWFYGSLIWSVIAKAQKGLYV
jgi:lysophospholipase